MHNIEKVNWAGDLLVVLVMRIVERLRLEVQSEVTLVGAREPPGLGAVALHLGEPTAEGLSVGPHLRSSK